MEELPVVDGRVNNSGQRGNSGRPRNSKNKPGHKAGKAPSKGRPKGAKNRRTLEREAIEAKIREKIPLGLQLKGGELTDKIIQAQVAHEFKERVAVQAHNLLNAQMTLALGQQHLFKVVTAVNKAGKETKTHVLVEDPEEIRKYLDDPTMENGEEYFYITTKEPSESAINNLLDRLLGKAANKVVGADNPDGSEGPVKVIVANFPGNQSQDQQAANAGHIAGQVVHEVIQEENDRSSSTA